MRSSFHLTAAIVISALALVITNPGWASEDSRARPADNAQKSTRMTPPTRALSVQQASQRLVRQLRPEQALRFMQTQANGSGNPQYKPTDPAPPKYEVADCTGSNGVPKACCSYTPGGGSSCDMFILLCDQMSGTTSAGGSSAATCSGEGVLE